jgi:hypothetical protein
LVPPAAHYEVRGVCREGMCGPFVCSDVWRTQVHDSNGNPLYWIDVALANSLPEYALRWNARYF